MLFHKHHTVARTVLPIAFFGGLISLLVISDVFGPMQATTIVLTHGDEVTVEQSPPPLQPLPRCKVNEDCPLPTTYCSKSGKCTLLSEPICGCSQDNVLRCYEESGRARFLFCPNGCSKEGDEAKCE